MYRDLRCIELPLVMAVAQRYRLGVARLAVPSPAHDVMMRSRRAILGLAIILANATWQLMQDRQPLGILLGLVCFLGDFSTCEVHSLDPLGLTA